MFDPDTEKFSEIATTPIALSVSAASHLSAGDLVGSLPGSGAQEIKSREQGIFQNVTDPAELRDQRVSIVALAGAAAGLWGGLACLMAAVSAHRRKSGDIVWQRRRQARRTALGKLAEARTSLSAGRSMDALRSIRSALVGLIADMRNVVGEGLTSTEADAILAESAVPAAERADALRLLQAIESAEYGSGAASDAPALVETAERLIPSLARHLERGS